jgi:hypothetical protein
MKGGIGMFDKILRIVNIVSMVGLAILYGVNKDAIFSVVWSIVAVLQTVIYVRDIKKSKLG